MKTLGRPLQTALLLTLVLAVKPALYAQETNPERGMLEIGVRALAGDRDSSQFNEYRDLQPGFFVQQFETNLDHLFQRNYFLNLQSRQTGRNDQGYRLSFGAYSKFHFDFRWNETPHDFTNTAVSLYQESAPGVFTFPGAMRTSLQSNSALLPSILGGAQPLDMSIRRKLGSGLFEYTPTAGWAFQLQYAREAESGFRPLGALLGSNMLELPEPIQYQTQQTKAGVEYGAGRGGFQASFSNSVFSNQVSDVVWDNPFRTTDIAGTSARGRMGLYPDNTAQTLTFAGAYNLSGSTRVMGSVSPQWMHQNDAFVPFTINSATTGVSQLPANSLNGKKQRLAMNYTLTSHPLTALVLTAHYRSYDYQNDTPSLRFANYVQTDGNVNSLARQSLPYSYTRQNTGLDASWLLHKGETLSFGYEWEGMDRQHRDVASSGEHTGSVSLDSSPKKWLMIKASYKHSERSPKDYVPNEELNPLGEGSNAVAMPAGWRMFDEAARRRNKADALVEIDATDRLSFSASAGTMQDHYQDSLYGLLSYRSFDSTGDVSYQLTPNLSVFADYTYERYKSDQRARQYSATSNTPNNDWESYLRDGIHTLGWGISASGLRHKMTIDAFYNLSIAKGLTTTRALGNPLLAGFLVTAVEDYPETSNRFHDVTTAVRYKLGEHIYSKIEYRFERYDRVDFQIQGMTPYMVPFDSRTNTSIFLGADVPGYQVHIVSTSLEYRF